MAFIDFRTPAAGFDEPLELWQACHERVTRMVNLLERLNQHIGEHGVDDDAGVTATSIRRYFDEAAPRHHEDEEVDLFPLLGQWLRDERRTDKDKVAETIARLESDHRELGKLWPGLRATLAAIERKSATTFDAAAVSQFVHGYREHVRIEDTVIAPALKRALKSQDIERIGKAMAQRRGVDWQQLNVRQAPKKKK